MKRFNRPLKTMILLTLLGLISTACSFVGIRTSEEPNYTIKLTEGAFELREYDPFIIAETYVTGDFREAGRRAFRKIGGYIFGNNVAQEKIAMTAAVVQEPKSEKIAMTIPVVQEGGSEKGWRFYFVMPAEYTLETLPTPTDSSVALKTVDRALVATIKFSGSYSDEKIAEQTEVLRTWIKTQGYTIISAPRTAWYDPPTTPAFLRRNEIHFDVKK